MKTAASSRTPEEPVTAVSTEAGPENSQAKETSTSVAGSSKPAAYLHAKRKLLIRISAVGLAIGVIAGIATIRNTPEVSVVTAVPTKTEITEVSKPAAALAVNSIPGPVVTDPTIPTAPVVGEFGFSLGSPNQPILTPATTKTKEAIEAPKPEAIPSIAPPAVAEAPKPSPEPTTVRKEFVEIPVQLTIQDGRVAEAQVGNRQPGAEAFEATALHIARQRRYPPGTSRTETVVVRVANQFGRKEP